MLNLSPRFLLSPRFFALPLIAIAVLIGLAQASNRTAPTGNQAAAPIVRATTCATAGKAADAACATVRDDTRMVR